MIGAVACPQFLMWECLHRLKARFRSKATSKPQPLLVEPQMKYTHPWIEPSIEAYTRKFVSQHLWRFHDDYEYNDLVSEAWIVLDKVASKYGDITIKHLMALYKTSLFHRFCRLATESRYRENQNSADELMEDIAFHPVAPGDFHRCLINAPKDIKRSLSILIEDPGCIVGQRQYRGDGFKRLTRDAALRAKLKSEGVVEGVNWRHKPASRIKAYLKGEDVEGEPENYEVENTAGNKRSNSVEVTSSGQMVLLL